MRDKKCASVIFVYEMNEIIHIIKL